MPIYRAPSLYSTIHRDTIEPKNPKSPFFNRSKIVIKPNNSIIIARDKYNDRPQINQSFGESAGDMTLREKSIFEGIIANSTLYDRTLCTNQSGGISINQIFTPPQKGDESIDTFATKSQLNRTSEFFNQTAILNY